MQSDRDYDQTKAKANRVGKINPLEEKLTACQKDEHEEITALLGDKSTSRTGIRHGHNIVKLNIHITGRSSGKSI